MTPISEPESEREGLNSKSSTVSNEKYSSFVFACKSCILKFLMQVWLFVLDEVDEASSLVKI